jgi:hypothetical protein
MKLQYLIIGILTFFMSCGLIPLPTATAQGDTQTVIATKISNAETLAVTQQAQVEATAPALDVWAVVTQILNAVWNVLREFGIPSLLVAWLMDFLIRIIPPLAPFRNLVLAWVDKKLEDTRISNAENAVLFAGQDMRTMKPDEDDLPVAKRERYDLAFTIIKAKNRLTDAQADQTLETAVARLKSRGINP